MIFIDTSAWYAASSKREANYEAARRFLATADGRLVTTDYVVDETLTLFRARGEEQHALAFGAQVINDAFAEIIAVQTQDFLDAWQTFQRYHDKQWSFTDCVSRVVMHRLGIKRAFAFDDHFRQFGNVIVVP